MTQPEIDTITQYLEKRYYMIPRTMNTCASREDNKLLIERIIIFACAKTNLEIENIKTPSRRAYIVNVRRLIVYLARKYVPQAQLSLIGECLSRDHSSVIQSEKKLKELMCWDKALCRWVEEIDLEFKKYISNETI